MIETNNLPKHVAIIMDGNGRWAKAKGKNRVFGHRSGTQAVKKIVETSAEMGIDYLTLYAFSTENWDRPKTEVSSLMDLLIKALRRELDKMLSNNIQLRSIGDISQLPAEVEKELKDTIEKTSNNSGMVLTLALNYGARQELTQAIQEISRKVKNNIISPENVDETIINEHLYTRNLPGVDLLIRTSGEQRISNFLLWQIAYAELYFSTVLWPDFNEEHFKTAIDSYKKRERRFGKTSEQLTN
ncbi:isoprenyl transferase [Flavobacteriaceae bacterium]|nr:isoprenyl transferase [Flavobacteriaceae bacterium]MDC1060704.1 isoprenyl transferase [Flavobacteriaceae bacterium]